MMCDKCNEKEHDMIFDFTQSGSNPNGKVEHVCNDCWSNLMWRVKSV